MQTTLTYDEQKPDDGFALHHDESKSFRSCVEMHEDWSKGINLREGFVPSTFLIAVVERCSIGHQLNNFLLKIADHIGYGTAHACREVRYTIQMVATHCRFVRIQGYQKCCSRVPLLT